MTGRKTRDVTGVSLAEIAIAFAVVTMVFGLAFGLLIQGMQRTRQETLRLAGVRTLILLRTMVQRDLARLGPDREVEIRSASHVRIRGGGGTIPGAWVDYRLVADGPDAGRIERRWAGEAARPVGRGFRGTFEASLDGTGRKLMLRLRSRDGVAGRALPGAPALELGLDVEGAERSSTLAGRFLPVFPEA